MPATSPRSLLLLLVLAAASCGVGTGPGGGGATTVLELSGRDIQITARLGGHIPDDIYFLGGRLTGTDAAGAYVAVPGEAADLVGSIAGGHVVDLDGDGDDDVVIEQIVDGEKLRTLDVWLRKGRSLDRVSVNPVPVSLLPEAQPGRASRETILAEEGRLARRIRSGDSEAVIVLDLATGLWARAPESNR